jgi:DNA-directed RNA polymerase specialized sigma24 family protein
MKPALTELEGLMKACERPLDYKAYRLSLTCSVEKQELIEVGRESAILAFFEYEEGMGKTIRSWMLAIAEQRMCKHVRIQSRRYYSTFVVRSEFPEIPSNNSELESRIFRESLNHMSTQAKEAIQLVFKMPLEFVKLLSENKPKKVKGRVREMLRGRGWSDRKINATFTEINDLLRESFQ